MRHAKELGLSIQLAATVLQPLIKREGNVDHFKSIERHRKYYKERGKPSKLHASQFEELRRRKYHAPCFVLQEDELVALKGQEKEQKEGKKRERG